MAAQIGSTRSKNEVVLRYNGYKTSILSDKLEKQIDKIRR